ncbi:hypothetical protein PS880_00522 [Pseudomonas fluorescens]|uniref:Uncharacterized protein n=1 Tax=Pseudomonas fluorescens TaxID=294 RepID=A0A5E7GW00_PSEFL|nr:hypothetical protein PS880_00522 [Pseudomonas fluorescens]
MPAAGTEGNEQDLPPYTDRSHAPRGNATRDALRHIQKRNAERPRRHSHAERGERSLPERSGFSEGSKQILLKRLLRIPRY